MVRGNVIAPYSPRVTLWAIYAKMDTMETATTTLPGHQNVVVSICKTRIRMMFQHEEAESRRDNRTMEIFYYECLYDSLREVGTHGGNLSFLNQIKAKIVKLHSIRLKTSPLNTEEAGRLVGEQPTLFHLIQMRKRRTARTVRSECDSNGFIQTSPKEITLSFTTFLR
jgi:hypothetical protein